MVPGKFEISKLVFEEVKMVGGGSVHVPGKVTWNMKGPFGTGRME